MIRRRLLPCLYLALVLPSPTLDAQSPAEAAHRYTSAHQQELIQKFSDLLSISNVAADHARLEAVS